MLASRLRDADAIIAFFAFLPMKARVARVLLDLAEDLGEETKVWWNPNSPHQSK